MTMSIMKRTASLSSLYCGGWPGKAGVNAKELPQESRLQIQGGGNEKLLRPELERETRELLMQLYRAHTGLNPRRGNAHPALPSLQKVLEGLLCKHRTAYTGMVQRLFNQAQGLDSMRSVLHSVFSDGVINWGRIASVLALGAMLCERLKQECVTEQAEECVDNVASQISSFLSTELQHWFINNKGWTGFVEFFHIKDPESTVRNALMAVAVLGIGVCLLTLMR